MPDLNHQRIVLILDDIDFLAVADAMRERDEFSSGLPAGGGNHAGRLVAEICRGWMEMLESSREEKP